MPYNPGVVDQRGLLFARGIDKAGDAVAQVMEEQKNRARMFKSLQEYAATAHGIEKDATAPMSLDELQGLVRGKEVQKIQEEKAFDRLLKEGAFQLRQEEQQFNKQQLLDKLRAQDRFGEDLLKLINGDPTNAQLQPYYEATTAEMPTAPAGLLPLEPYDALLKAYSANSRAMPPEQLLNLIQDFNPAAMGLKQRQAETDRLRAQAYADSIKLAQDKAALAAKLKGTVRTNSSTGERTANITGNLDELLNLFGVQSFDGLTEEMATPASKAAAAKTDEEVKKLLEANEITPEEAVKRVNEIWAAGKK